MARHVARQLWLAAFAAGTVLLVSSLGLRSLLSRRHPPAQTCRGLELPNLRALPNADEPPVLFRASAGVHLKLDGAVADASSPRRLALTVHRIRADAPGHLPLELAFRLEPFRPALVHVHESDDGLTAIFLGASCEGCPAPLADPDVAPRPPFDGSSLRLAAEHLRHGDWPQAARALQRVPPAERGSPRFHLLAATLHAQASRHAAARAELDALARTDRELAGLLSTFDALAQAEAKRRADVVTQRWNRTTERVGHLTERFAALAPSEVQAATDRLASLSRAFAEAAQKHDVVEQEEALAAAEQALARLVNELRASRPFDCPFQRDVVAAAVP